MRTLNIVVTGIGGQGVITTSVILANAALHAGLDALVAETHGLSQRGGTVIVHVKVGERVEAPLIPKGGADLVLALEPLEALRYADYLSPSGLMVVNTYIIPPPLPGVEPPPVEKVVEELRRSGARVYPVDATRKAIELGDARAANTYIVGYALGLNGFQGLITPEDVEAAIRLFGRNVEVNLRALHAGIEDGRRVLESEK